MALKCPSSFWDGSMHENARAIWLWKATYYGKEIPLGAELVLPVEGQRYRFKGVRLWAYRTNAKGARTKRREMSYTFESHCVICSAPFEFRVPSYFKALVRTCPMHRRMWRTRTAAPKPERKPARRDEFSHMGKLQLRVFNSYYETGMGSLETTCAHALAALEAAGRRVTRGNVTRAYRQLVKRGAIQVDDNGAALL